MSQNVWTNEGLDFLFEPIRSLIYYVNNADPHEDKAKLMSANEIARICMTALLTTAIRNAATGILKTFN